MRQQATNHRVLPVIPRARFQAGNRMAPAPPHYPSGNFAQPAPGTAVSAPTVWGWVKTSTVVNSSTRKAS